ncbi:MAG: dTMP kinase [Thermodesulfobacteriota bacterium]
MASTLQNGYLIVFEGIDGTGKSTQLKLLADFLRNRGHRVVETREPTDGPYGRKIRQHFANRSQLSLEEELELFIDDRRHHVEELITPELARGSVILCDRYYLSTGAYQGAAGLNVDDILKKNSFAPPPDLAIFLTAPIATGIERITSGRGETLNDFEQEESLTRVAELFDQMAFPYIRRIDATGTINQIHQAVCRSVLSMLEL